MAAFDYDAEAELFPSRGMRGQPVGEERYDAAGIRSLYEHADYPLDRTSRPAMVNREQRGNHQKRADP